MNGRAKQIAPLRRDRLEARRLGGLLQRRDGVLVLIGGHDLGAFRQPQRERSDAGEQIADALGRAAMLQHQRRQGRLAGGGGLQEGARRQHHAGAAHGHASAARVAPRSRRAGSAAPAGGVSASRASSLMRAEVSGPDPRTSTSRPASVAVTWMSSGLRSARERLGDGPGGFDRAIERRRQHRAMIDRHHVMRPQRREPDLEHVAPAPPGVEDGAAAALPMGRRSADRPARRRRQIPLARAPRPRGRASSRGTAPAPSAAGRSPRRFRNAGRWRRCAAGSRPRS